MNMDSLPINKRFHCNAPLPPPFIPNEIVAEILCLLPVQTILQLRCVSKAWKSLISGPTFVQKHFKKSSENPHLLFISDPFPMRIDKSVRLISLFETDPWIIVSNDNFLEWLDLDNCQVVGSCKGLLCLFFHHRYQNYWFWLWNPATRTLSEKLGTFQEYVYDIIYQTCNFTFGCDISSGNYKVVALSRVEVREENTLSVRTQFRVLSLSLGDNRWRNFQYCASVPVCLIYPQINNGLHLNGTVNWLALPKYIKPSSKYDWKSIANAQQFVIVSLDLSSETCTQFLLPPGFDEVPCFQPALNVLMDDCLCFSHDFKGIQFVIWQMKEFGVQESWTMLFKINYFDIQMLYPNIDNISHTTVKRGTLLLPLYLSERKDSKENWNCKQTVWLFYHGLRRKFGFSLLEDVCNSESKHIMCMWKYGRNIYLSLTLDDSEIGRTDGDRE